MVGVKGLEPPTSWSQRELIVWECFHNTIYSGFCSKKSALWRSCIRCFQVSQRALWSGMWSGETPFLHLINARTVWHFFIRFPAAVRHWPDAFFYPEPTVHRKTYFYTSNRNNESFLLTAVQRFRESMLRDDSRRPFCAECSLFDG